MASHMIDLGPLLYHICTYDLPYSLQIRSPLALEILRLQHTSNNWKLPERVLSQDIYTFKISSNLKTKTQLLKNDGVVLLCRDDTTF